VKFKEAGVRRISLAVMMALFWVSGARAQSDFERNEPGKTALGANQRWAQAVSVEADSGGNFSSSNPGVAIGTLIRHVEPDYPQIAKTAQVGGSVVLHCLIGRDGTMEAVRYISGPPLLKRSSMDAVRQWQYHPTLRDGEPVEVDTTVTVVYTLDGQSGQNGGAATPKPDDSSKAGPPGSADAQKAGPSASNMTGDSSAQTVPINPEFRARVLKLMEITEMTSNMDRVWKSMQPTLRPMLIQMLPPTQNRDTILDAYLEGLQKSMHSPDAMEGYIQIYARHLTLADVNAAIQFYSTPEGDHVRRAFQEMAPETMKWGEELALKNAPLILKSLCSEYTELQDDAKLCGKPADKSKSELMGRAAVAGN
jgi:TonB family protein